MILITGATGTAGSEIVKRLSAVGKPFRVLVRNREKAARLAGPGVEIAEGDLGKPDSLDRALEGVEKALLLSSPDPKQVELQGNFIQAAKRAGVKHVVKFSAMGAAADSQMTLARWHGQTEKQLEQSGMAYTHLQPNQFMQNFLGFAPSIAAEGVFYAPLKQARSSVVDVRDIAAVASAVLTGAGHEGKTYVITGPEALTYAQIAEKLSTVAGRKVNYIDVTPEQSKAGMIAAGMPAWLADAVNELYIPWSQGAGATTTNVIREVAGKQPTGFDQFARDHAAVFRGPQSAGA